MDTLYSYLERKGREIALLDRCLRTPLHPARPESVAAAIEQKFQLRAVLKADELLERESISETARPPGRWMNAGPFAFSFGYQRADLDVRGPSIYPELHRLRTASCQPSIYTGSGMGAIAALLTGLLQLNDTIEVLAPSDCYGETRELMVSLGPRIRMLPLTRYPCMAARQKADARILWVDSSTRRSFGIWSPAVKDNFDLVVFDTTCFWRSSARIRRIVQQAMRMEIPVALIRSHGKLDSLGIEYGRLGSVVLVMPTAGNRPALRWTGTLAPKIRDAVRLLGAAPILAHFPPFESVDDYRDCSTMRTASIVRNTRSLARALRSRVTNSGVTTFQHGLYLTIGGSSNACADEVKQAADEMAAELAAHDLPVKHAGSFGFDFVAVEWRPDPINETHSIRITGADLPLELSEEIGHRIAAWWLDHHTKSRHSLLPTGRKAAA